MLSYLLALAVGLGSFGLYMTAFFFPEVYRRYDLIWSGVGMFYALVLWVCAGRITGGLLLGQMASVALLGWFGYQTLQLRREQTPVEQRTPLPASANSVWEVAQVTVQKLRASFRQSADRSPLAAQLESAMMQIEKIWQSVRSRMDALISTTLNSATIPQSKKPDIPNSTKPDAESDDPEIEAAPDMETVESPASYPRVDQTADQAVSPTNNSATREIPPL